MSLRVKENMRGKIYGGLFFFLFYFCFFRVDLDEGKDLRSFIKDIRVFRYNLKDIKDILV